MWDCTITMLSAGKTFSAMGWQVGWCMGPSRLILPVHSLLPYVQFCTSTVRTLPRADKPYMGHGSYYAYLNEKYRRKHNMLATALWDAGFEVLDYKYNPGWGSSFILARITDQVRRALPPRRLPNVALVNVSGCCLFQRFFGLMK